MRSFRLCALALTAPLLLGGCAARQGASDPLHGVAASLWAGRAFDRAQSALRRGDNKAAGLAQDEALRAQLALSGDENSLAAGQLFNSAGYLLAENGTSDADFARAEELTSRAIRNSDRALSALAPDDPRRDALIADRAIGPRDSHAWALFKLRRWSQARAEQERVIREIRQSGYAGPLSPEIPFHLAEIYRALGENDKARAAYNAATGLGPDDALQKRIAAGLLSLEFKPV